ncbi:MAG: hypothetical protein K2H86_09200 [Muribaculaceae bacterium]|nr:hypothetical protein [Muribaculaceae bacterium]
MTQIAFKEEFINWLKDFRNYEDSTIKSRIGNIERIQDVYGSLIEQYRKDNFENILHQLTYTKADEQKAKKYTGPLTVSGDTYNCLATYKSALRLYGVFLSTREFKETGFPFGEIGEKVNRALSRLDSTISKKKLSYTQKEVKKLIIEPLIQYLDDELGISEQYTFCTEMNPIFNSEKKNKDRYDIIGMSKDKPVIVVEVDTHRSDQISKKIISRLAFNEDKELLYVCLLYPNLHEKRDSERKECIKYIDYINSLFGILTTPQKRFMYHTLY